jgi:carbon monoxide dehydrogenase subunit G
MALEKFTRTIDVSVSADRAWQVLTNVEELTSWVGIVHSATELERLKSYTAVLEDRVGPFHLRADLSISVDVLEEGSAIHVEASGQDRAVNSKISILGDLRLTELPAGGCQLTVTGSYQVTGRVASMGGGIVRRKGDLAVEQFFSGAIRALGTSDKE